MWQKLRQPNSQAVTHAAAAAEPAAAATLANLCGRRLSVSNRQQIQSLTDTDTAVDTATAEIHTKRRRGVFFLLIFLRCFSSFLFPLLLLDLLGVWCHLLFFVFCFVFWVFAEIVLQFSLWPRHKFSPTVRKRIARQKQKQRLREGDS